MQSGIILQWYQQPTRSSKICFSLILSSLLYMFRTTVSPIFRSTLTVQKVFCNTVPTVLSAAYRWHSLDGTVTPGGSRQHRRYIVPKSCVYSQSAPEDGQNCRPKHVQQAWKNKWKTNFAASCWLLISLCWWSTVTQTSNGSILFVSKQNLWHYYKTSWSLKYEGKKYYENSGNTEAKVWPHKQEQRIPQH